MTTRGLLPTKSPEEPTFLILVLVMHLCHRHKSLPPTKKSIAASKAKPFRIIVLANPSRGDGEVFEVKFCRNMHRRISRGQAGNLDRSTL